MVYLVPDEKTPPSIAKELKGPSVRQELDRLGIAKTVRIDFPMVDQHNLRRTAEILSRLSNSLHLCARRTDITERNALIEAFWEIRAAAQEIRSASRVSRRGLR